MSCNLKKSKRLQIKKVIKGIANRFSVKRRRLKPLNKVVVGDYNNASKIARKMAKINKVDSVIINNNNKAVPVKVSSLDKYFNNLGLNSLSKKTVYTVKMTRNKGIHIDIQNSSLPVIPHNDKNDEDKKK